VRASRTHRAPWSRIRGAWLGLLLAQLQCLRGNLSSRRLGVPRRCSCGSEEPILSRPAVSSGAAEAHGGDALFIDGRPTSSLLRAVMASSGRTFRLAKPLLLVASDGTRMLAMPVELTERDRALLAPVLARYSERAHHLVSLDETLQAWTEFVREVESGYKR